MNHYTTLAVSPRASMEEIRQAYREAVKKYHPDRHPDTPERYEEQFKQVQAAYAVLSDPIQRSQYDYRMGFSYQTPPQSERVRKPPQPEASPMPPSQTVRAKTDSVWQVWRHELRYALLLLLGSVGFGVLFVLTAPAYLRAKLAAFFVLLALLMPAWRLFHLHYRRATLEVRFRKRTESLIFFSKFGLRNRWFKREVKVKNIGYAYGKEPNGEELVRTLRVYQFTLQGNRRIFEELCVLRPDPNLWTPERIGQLASLLSQVAAYRRKQTTPKP